MSRTSGIGRFFNFAQVLSGKIPFCGIRPTELGQSVVQGMRPDKPENASAIGLSDLVWDLVHRCWNCDMELRPKAAEVRTYLGKATADWGRLMPPCVRVETTASESGEELSDFGELCECEILILP